MNKKKRKAREQVTVFGQLPLQRSIMSIDPKSELASVTRRMREHTGVGVINPFVLLLPKHIEACGKCFRLCVRTAFDDLQKNSGGKVKR